MADGFIEIQIKGFKELETYLNDFTEKVAKSAVASGVLAGANIVVQAAKASAPMADKPHYFYAYRRKIRGGGRRGAITKYLIQPGNIRRNLRAIRVKSSLASVMYAAGPIKRRGKGSSYEEDPWYWRFHEFGTRKKGARPFLRPAFDQNISRIIEAVRVRLQYKIEKENARLARLVSA
jgi:HK97 gp10 family phage protein